MPRTGGVILAKAGSRNEVDNIISEDPFYIEGIADYEVTEFVPAMVAEGFEALQTGGM